MLKILGRKNSSNVQKVLWTCGELGVPFEREDVGMQFGRNKEPEYLAMNPNGLVPTIIDDGLILWESNAIVRYLCAKHGAGKLWANDPAERATADKWMDWGNTVLDDAFVHCFMGLVRTAPEKRDQAAIQASRDATAKALAMLDQALGKTKYVGGAQFSMGDIPLGPIAYRWHNLQIKRENFPNLRGWYERMTQRPAFREHVMITIT